MSAELLAFAGLCAAGFVLSLISPSRLVRRIVAWFGGLGAVPLFLLGGRVALGRTSLDATFILLPNIGPTHLRADPLSGVFLVVTAVCIAASSLFAPLGLAQLAKRYSVRAFGALYFLLIPAIVTVLLAYDVFSLLFTWEVMSLACFAMIGIEHQEPGRPQAAYLSLAMGEAGAVAVAVGLLLLASRVHSLDFSVIRTAGSAFGPGLRATVFGLAFFGFGVKAGLLPVNGWLPRAYAASPVAFVPLLAGATLNLGLYGIVRVGADVCPPASAGPGLIVLVVGALTALIGILYATTENDFKTLLAHSSIENAGIIMTAFGAGLVFAGAGLPHLASIATLVALYHMVNHSVFKTLLYIGAGTVELRTGVRDLDDLGGLLRRMPWTGAAMLVGVLSIAGLPPFNGFISEWLTLQTLLRSAELNSVGLKIVFAICGAGLALTAALAMTCFAKVFAMGFLGIGRSNAVHSAREAGGLAIVPMVTLAALCLALGTLPTYVIGALNPAAATLSGSPAAAELVPPFFHGSAGSREIPTAFAAEFHDLGARLGEGVAPGPGLVVLHRGGQVNPVVFAAAPSYLVIAIVLLLALVFVVVRFGPGRGQQISRRAPWDGGLRRLLPEMTYTATGFSNPVRVIFQAIFQPTVIVDTRAAVARHFRTAIRREVSETHVVDRLVLRPARWAGVGIAHLLARLHHGRINAYLAYLLLALVVSLVWLLVLSR